MYTCQNPILLEISCHGSFGEISWLSQENQTYQNCHLQFTDSGSAYQSQIVLVKKLLLMLSRTQYSIRTPSHKPNRLRNVYTKKGSYEGCSNMNASSFITFFTYMLRQNVLPFWKELFVAFRMAPNIKQHSLYSSSYRPLYKGHSSILKFF